jgi:hypothetical protein
MPQISCLEFKKSHPAKFENLVLRLVKDRGVSRGEAHDVIDEEFTFELLPSGNVRVTNDLNGRQSTIPPSGDPNQ